MAIAHKAGATLIVIDPARTLVLVASKTFTTQETMANARLVRAWLYWSGSIWDSTCGGSIDEPPARTANA